MSESASEVWWSLKKVLKLPQCILVASLATAIVVVMATWLPNLGLIKNTIKNSELSHHQKQQIIISLVGSIKTNFSTSMQVMIIVSAILGGIQLALVLYHLRHKVTAGKEAGLGIIGIMSSLLGVGCASCGSIAITSVLGLGATSSVMALLPYHGAELGSIGLIVIAISVFVTAKKLYQTQFCKLK